MVLWLALAYKDYSVPKEFAHITNTFDSWCSTVLGEVFLTLEYVHLSAALTRLFGYYLLQLGDKLSLELSHSSTISNFISCNQSIRGLSHHVAGEYDALPFATHSIDVVLLPHILEFVSHPNHVVSEAARVLISEGHLVITGFNPFSLWGIRRLFSLGSKKTPWCGTFHSVYRLKQWLAFLDCEVVQCHYFWFTWPSVQARFPTISRALERLGEKLCPWLGGGYVLVAKKQQYSMTRLRRPWFERKRRRRLIAEPSARSVQEK